MKTFKDNKGRSWELDLNVYAIKRVKDLLKVDLLDLEDGRIFKLLLSEPITLCDTVYVLIKPEADEKGISDDDFGISMAGDAIEHATTALLEELTDFFPNPARRAVMRKTLKKMKGLEGLVVEIVEKMMDDPVMLREMRESIESMLGESSGNLPESSESTLALSHSAN